MEPEKLEKIIFDFVNYDYDVLLATTIIESGIDIPNANTTVSYTHLCNMVKQKEYLSELQNTSEFIKMLSREIFCSSFPRDNLAIS